MKINCGCLLQVCLTEFWFGTSNIINLEYNNGILVELLQTFSWQILFQPFASKKQAGFIIPYFILLFPSLFRPTWFEGLLSLLMLCMCAVIVPRSHAIDNQIKNLLLFVNVRDRTQLPETMVWILIRLKIELKVFL